MLAPLAAACLDAAGQCLDNSNMPSARAPQRPRRLPAYALYGEALHAMPLLAHWEPIAERSRLHGWEIRPHQHTSLCQLVVIHSGRAQVLLDGRQHSLRGPALITVPAWCAHGFVFAPSIKGDVFTVSERHLRALLQAHPGLGESVLRPQADPLQGCGKRGVMAAAGLLRDEAAGTDTAWHHIALDAALLQLAVAVARARPKPGLARGAGRSRGPSRDASVETGNEASKESSTDVCTDASADPSTQPATAPRPRAMRHVQRLRALVEIQYRQHPTQTALAAALNISPTQLNRACQQMLGHPAQAVLHARLLLQAQRELAYTELPIKQIALELGFSDAAYFTRFFRRHAGLAPGAWRWAQRRGAAP